MQCSPTRLISVGLVKEYVYCPVIAWFKANSLFREEVTPSMELGSRVDLESIADEYGLPKPRFYEEFLRDDETGVAGKPDIIAGCKRRFVVEVKVFSRDLKRAKHFREQARLYAFLVERVLGRVEKYAVIMDGEMYSWDYTYYDHEYCMDLIDRVKRCISKPEPPEPEVGFKCTYCFYRRICPYATNCSSVCII